MKAFRPADVYPCTVDEETWRPEDSIECLFGHLCSGNTFIHDRIMESLINQRASSGLVLDGDDSQILTSSREGSIESQLSPNEDAVLGNQKRSSSDPAPCFRTTDEPYHRSKRRRLSPTFTGKSQGGLDLNGEQLHKIKQSFRDHLRATRGTMTLSTRVGVESVSRLRDEARVATRDLTNLPHGTQTEPIELSDSSLSSTNDEAGDFLLGEMLEPDSITNTAKPSDSGSETQLSLP